MRLALPAAVVLAALAAAPAHAQSRSYYYGRPVLTEPAPSPRGDVVYGSGMGRPVNFDSPRNVYYSPGFATTTYLSRDAVYSPPGFFEPTYYDPLPFSTRPSTVYLQGSYNIYRTPGYYTPARSGGERYYYRP